MRTRKVCAGSESVGKHVEEVVVKALAWREKRLEMAQIQISVPARENYRVIKGF
jgi:hypothetical protein